MNKILPASQHDFIRRDAILVTVYGEEYLLADACRLLNLHYPKVYSWMNRNKYIGSVSEQDAGLRAFIEKFKLTHINLNG